MMGRNQQKQGSSAEEETAPSPGLSFDLAPKVNTQLALGLAPTFDNHESGSDCTKVRGKTKKKQKKWREGRNKSST